MDVRLGNKRDARKAVLAALEEVGQGAYRTVYADRNRRFIYKVDRQLPDPKGRHKTGNQEEYTSYITVCGADPEAKNVFAPTSQWTIDVTLEQLLEATGRSQSSWCNSNCQWLMEPCEVREYDYDRDEWVTTIGERPVDPPTVVEHIHPNYVRCFVNVQPYYPTSGSQDWGSDNWSVVQRWEDTYGVGDLHEENWRVDHMGKPWITDFQFTGDFS